MEEASAKKSKHLESELWDVAERLHKQAIHLLRSLRIVDERTGLSPARLSALSVLVFAGPKSPGDLARIEQVKPPTMTRLIGGLAEDGLVEITVQTRDARAKLVKVTPKGRRLMKRARDRRLEQLVVRLEGLSAREKEVLTKAIDILESHG